MSGFKPPDTLRAPARKAFHREQDKETVMRQGTPCEPGYHLPEEAHQQLQSLCHYLHLLAELSQPEHTNPDALILPRAGLAHCFTQLAEAADQIAATTAFRPG